MGVLTWIIGTLAAGTAAVAMASGGSSKAQRTPPKDGASAPPPPPGTPPVEVPVYYNEELVLVTAPFPIRIGKLQDGWQRIHGTVTRANAVMRYSDRWAWVVRVTGPQLTVLATEQIGPFPGDDKIGNVRFDLDYRIDGTLYVVGRIVGPTLGPNDSIVVEFMVN